MLEDNHSWIESRRQWYKNPPSHPIGDETYFRNETESPGTLRLTFSRYNVEVDFGLEHPRFDHNHLYYSKEDIQMLERFADDLDKAIVQQNPSMHIEPIRFYQFIIALFQGLLLIFFLLILRLTHART